MPSSTSLLNPENVARAKLIALREKRLPYPLPLLRANANQLQCACIPEHWPPEAAGGFPSTSGCLQSCLPSRDPTEPDPHNESGEAVLEMIQSEHQLSRDPASAAAEWMVQLLEALLAFDWARSPREIAQSYQVVGRRFARQGPSISVKPRLLFRYVNSPGIFEQIRKALETAGSIAYAVELNRLITDASGGLGQTWRDVLAFVQDDAVWTAIPHRRVRLSGHHSTFVTFDLDGRAKPLQASAAKMHAALALWKPVNGCFVELQYRPGQDEVLRFPTLADAGWFRFFQSARAGEPHGWTRPHDLTLGSHPEAVHDDAAPTLTRVERSVDIRVLPP